MKILVTGSSGFLGFHLLKLFEKEQKKHKLFALYNKNKPIGLKKTTKLIKTDLVKINFSSHYDLVIHCASKTRVNTKNDKILYSDNINSLKQILKKISFNNFVFMSSNSVYGNINGMKINEKTKLNAKDYYGKSKIKCEKFIEKFSNKNKKKILVLRLPAAVGINSHSNFISNLMWAYKKNQPNLVTINNKEDLFNNTIHSEEIYNFIKTLLNKKTNFFYNVFVLGSKNPIRLKNLISIYKNFYNKKIKLKYIISKNKNKNIDFSKALKFGFKPIKTSSTILKMLKDNNSVK
jgi:UDP-glucose 4-epimerase